MDILGHPCCGRGLWARFNRLNALAHHGVTKVFTFEARFERELLRLPITGDHARILYPAASEWDDE